MTVSTESKSRTEQTKYESWKDNMTMSNINKSQLNTAVLLLVFNRLDTTQEVIKRISQVRPSRLYIAADGGRTTRPEEFEQVKAVQNYILANIDWECDIKTLFREQNLGCRVAVSTAIDWFFEHESQGIILEDDCLPEVSFFNYAQQLLDHYQDDERIMMISGNCFSDSAAIGNESYFFSRHIHIWGWATWRRAWKHYDRNMKQWEKLRNSNWLLTIGDGQPAFQRYWSKLFDESAANRNNSWAYRWVFSCWAQNGFSILPNCNLVQNIGFGLTATHTTHPNPFMNRRSTQISLPLIHPITIIRNYEFDRWTDQNIFKTRLVDRLRHRVIKPTPHQP
jgi:hypothetical protein